MVKSDGTIWFTDPSYGITSDYEGDRAESEIGACHVYRLDPADGALTAVAEDFVRPNGLAFSPDEKTLYIADSSVTHDPAGNHHIRAFDVVEGRRLAKGRVFTQISPGFPDGFRCDTQGNVWCSSGDGVQVFAPDGTLSPDKSLILVDLNTLKTDSGSRDNYLKRNTLEVDKFPNASFAPSKAEGMPSPLPAAGEASFTMTGMTSIHGIQKEVTWKVTAKRDGATITGKATATVMFGDFGMTIPRAAAVLSVKDEIRLEIDLSATAE